MNKRIFSVAGLLITTIVVIVGASIMLAPKPTNTKNTVTDHDTGEVYDATVNNFQTGGDTIEGTSGLSVIFGVEKFMNAVYSHGYKSTNFATDVRNAIYKYSDVRFKNSFSSITLRPQNLVFDENLITGQLRMGQGDDFANFTVHIFADGKASIIKITHSDQPDLYYIGGLDRVNQTLFTVSQDDFSGPNVTIDTFSYRETALKSLENLGYSIPDLNIKFTHYRNPFL